MTAGQHRDVARWRALSLAEQFGEVVVDFLAGSNEYDSTGPSLQKYFDHFALAARRAHLAGSSEADSRARAEEVAHRSDARVIFPTACILPRQR